MYLNNFQSYLFDTILIIMVCVMMCFVGCEKVATEPKSIQFGESVVLNKMQSIY
jgi:hypothetical protein